MNRTYCFSFLILVALFAGNSCRLVSLKQFYCKEDIIPVPAEVLGSWESRDFKVVFHKDCATISSKAEKPEEKPTKLDVTFFKTGEKLFADAWFMDDEKLAYPGRGYFVMPCHVLFKIELKDGMLEARPFSYDWICSQVKAAKIGIPHVLVENPKKANDSRYIFTASPEEWKKILQQYSSVPEAFENPEKFKRISGDDSKKP